LLILPQKNTRPEGILQGEALRPINPELSLRSFG